MTCTRTTHPVFYPMTNVIQNYAWGSTSSLTQLFDVPNSDNQPQAEIWMGAHPNGCSTIESDGELTLLSSLIASDKTCFLNPEIAEKFGELPYLFKVLAADKALSIQVHPNKQQAEHGFQLEERLGVALNASNRNYKDPNHKPELVYALTPYQAMNGFRAIKEIVKHFTALDITILAPLVNSLQQSADEQGLKHFFNGLLSLPQEQKQSATAALMQYAAQHEEAPFPLILALEKQYPGDIGLFAPLLLNVITLEPGEAMFLDAETPHAYIKGTGLEIMANSDNVLRAGLTPKYMDVDELVACTRFEEKPFEQLRLQPTSEHGIEEYPIPVDDFRFAIIRDSIQRTLHLNSAEILLPIDAPMVLNHANGERCTVAKGQSVFIPACTEHYQLTCSGRVARAYC
ncbi:mannose-6-phosphate isomerase, class I [Vibrio sp. NTOU-M3]|uniref:mannose-6-phosphate isomerase, class I n=1 Tax=Vibrio sp. NTOU-M3 TaxID=3234954 RepID=UPI00349F1ABE